MTSYYVEFIFNVSGPVDEAAQDHFDEVHEAFAAIPDVDGDVGVNLAEGRVDLCMTVDADDRQDALMKAFIAARTAVHAAGGATPSWDGWLTKLLDSDNYRSNITPSFLAVGDCPKG